jgi:hypothetical protein
MKIEYLEDGSKDCPLIRIYGNQIRDLKTLHHHVLKLCTGDKTHIKVHELPGFTGIDRCKLTFHISRRDKGVFQINKTEFTCNLEAESWRHVEGQIKALVESPSDGYQWLNESNNISLLLSTYETGAW